MEFMRPLAVEKERQNDNTAAAAQRVSQSVGHSVTQTASQPSPPEHCNHHQKQNPTIINHSSQSCIQVAGVRTDADAVFSESVHKVIVSVEISAYIAPPYCTNGSTARAAQTKRITTTTKPNTANEHSCVQQQVAVSKKRWCSKPLAHQLTAY